MQKSRLDALSDGIFAIVMTLLVIEIKVPTGAHNNKELLDQLIHLSPLFLSYLMSFTILSSYWMAHHFIVSIFSINLTRKMAYLNMPFLMAVALIPFSTLLLGEYPTSQLAIAVYGMNITLTGALLFIIFRYAIKAKDIQNAPLSRKDIFFGNIRILLPPLTTLVAIPVSFMNTQAAIAIFIVVVVFNFIPGGLNLFDIFLSRIFARELPGNEDDIVEK